MGRGSALGDWSSFTLAVATVALMATVGCGPSIRMVHQSNNFFEHCHAADFEASVTPSERGQCWAVWLHHYTLGQSPDRLVYARQRIVDIQTGREGVAPMPGVSTSQLEGAYTASYLSLGAPNADAHAEADVQVEGDAETAAEKENEADVTPGEVVEAPPQQTRAARRPQAPNADHECSEACAPRWDACIVRCNDPHSTCRHTCEAHHRTCLAGCF